jgi:membrane protease YdiL (CAAX protease family)
MLVGWVALVAALSTLSYAGNFLVDDTGNVTLSQVSSTSSGVSLDTSDASVDVAAGTAAGSQTLAYRICERASPSNCDAATVAIVVAESGAGSDVSVPPDDAATGVGTIVAVDDSGAAPSTGGSAVANVLVNDRLGDGTAYVGQRGDILYLWSSAIAGTVQYLVVIAIVLAIGHSLAPEVLGLRRPTSWWYALRVAAAGLGAIFLLGLVLNLFLKAGDEQGLVPDGWDGSRAAPFAANFVVVVLLAPIVEELTFRGLGVAVVRDAVGATPAILITGLAFGLAHGLVVALPVLAAFGVILAIVRVKTESLYPAILLHAVFNGLALIVAVTAGDSL